MNNPQTNKWSFAGLKLLTAFIAGALLTFSYAPFDFYFLTIPLLAWVIWCGWDATPGEGWKLGFSFGLGWFGAGLSWIYVSIDQFGGLPLIATLAILALLYIYLALFPALAFYLWRRLQQHTNAAVWVLPLFWLIAELLRGWLFTGFPWLRLGYSQIDSNLANLVPLIGEIGLSVVLVIMASAIAAAFAQKNWRLLSLPAVIFAIAIMLGWQHQVQRTGETVSVALVQGNIPQSLKWDASQQWPTVLKYLDLSRPYYNSHDLIIWPESAITILEPFAGDVLANIDQALQLSNTALVTGIIDYRRGADAFYNTLIVLGQQQQASVTNPLSSSYEYLAPNRYQKYQLLPIGEFVPFEDLLRPLAPLFNLPMSSFSRGQFEQDNLQANGYLLTSAICYEIAFPGQVRKNLQNDTNFLLTVSNDTWFGRSHGPWQHMQIARMRALELGRPLLRATNSGVTGIVDEKGRWLAAGEQFTEQVVSAEVPLVTGRTWYHQFGNLGAWLLALSCALITCVSMVKQRKKQ